MGKFGVFALAIALCGALQASWYWPVGSDAVDEKPKRISELIEPASDLIDEASDLAADGKTDEAVDKYRQALSELDEVERQYPERVKSPEFATLRNKRAYVVAAIDSLLLMQVRANAKAVAVSDTSELERRLDRERWGKRLDKAREAIESRNPEAALTELERARTGTTNTVQLAVTYGVVAGTFCQKGEFGKACRYLALYSKELAHTGVRANTNAITREERALVYENLQILRDRIVGGYGKSVALGRRVCEASAQLEKTDLSTTNAVMLARDVVRSLGAMQGSLCIFAFPTARNLSRASTNLQLRASNLLARMETGTNLTWKVNLSDLKSAVATFVELEPEIKGVDAGISSVMKTLGVEEKKAEAKKDEAKGEGEVEGGEKAKEVVEKTSRTTMRDQAMEALAKGDYAAAEKIIRRMLADKPDGVAALNLKAALEARQGKLAEAEETLARAMQKNPRSHFAYYNMANLMLQVRPKEKEVARRYYEAGRSVGGPVNARLEEAFK